jgi:hypothetical protein
MFALFDNEKVLRDLMWAWATWRQKKDKDDGPRFIWAGSSQHWTSYFSWAACFGFKGYYHNLLLLGF